MKFVLVFVLLFLAGGIYGLSHFGVIAQPILDHIVDQEGSVADLQSAAQKDGFAAKYQGDLDQRFWLARVAIILDDDTFGKIAADSRDRYVNTPLQTDSDFGYLVFHLADLYAARNQFNDAGAAYRQYMTLFPTGESFEAARGAILNLRINHGFN